MKKIAVTFFVCCTAFLAKSQTEITTKEEADSLYIQEVEDDLKPDKVLHAEPLYIDLIRDLGARKGEREWNVGFGLTDKARYDEYEALVEYEWAPMDRLGLEVEIPFTFYYPNAYEKGTTPGSRMNSLKLAGQYTFLVSKKYATSLALGYIHELEFAPFRDYGRQAFIEGNVYNPFFIAAKRFGNNYHTLLYTGPAISHHFAHNEFFTSWQINSNFHYMITGTRNFIGVEFNKEINEGVFEMTVRPQMRVGISENVLIGIVTGIPISRENQRFSSFLRLIYEP